MEFAYFQKKDSEQFSFYRIPKLLFSDERFQKLSTDAKLLYGVMLDRVGLSQKNGWVDEEGNVFIRFTIEEMMSYFKWSRYWVFRILDELDDKSGIGLIERRRQGFRLPNIIYVKNFAAILWSGEDTFSSGIPEVRQTDFQKYDMSDFKKYDGQTSRSMADGLQEVGQADSNNTNKSETDKSNTERKISEVRKKGWTMGSFQNVYLAENELKELKSRFPYDWQERVERLSSYMASTGKKYRNHYATICSWAVKEKKASQKNYDVPEGKGL